MLNNLAVAFAILWWMLCGAAITMAIVYFRMRNVHDEAERTYLVGDEAISAEDAVSRLANYAPYSELLGKPCWKESRRNKGCWVKFRVVAVSHKGAVSIRPWENESGRGAFWVPANKVADKLRFEEVQS